jgi:hypothetical protein
VRGAERHLLGLGEEVVRVAVQHEPADGLHRYELFGHELGGVEHVEAERVRLVLREDLQAELVLGIGARLDRLPEVAPVEVRVGPRDLHGLVPVERVGARERVPVELHEARLTALVDEPECVHAESLHHAIAARDAAVGHHPHQHVRRFGHQRHEVPERVVCARRLWHRVVRLGLHSVDQVGKLHRVLDEEDGDVVADQVPVALIGVELHREAARVARGVRGSALAHHRGETHERGRALAGLGEDGSPRELRERLVALEVAVCARPTRVHDALGNPLVVEVGDLLAQDEVFEQRGPTRAGFERVLVVRDLHALVGGERMVARIHADAVQRPVAAVGAEHGLSRAELRRGLVLRDRAARGVGGARLESVARDGPTRCVAVLAGLPAVVRHRRSECLGGLHAPLETVVHIEAGARASGAAHGRAACGLRPRRLIRCDRARLRSFPVGLLGGTSILHGFAPSASDRAPSSSSVSCSWFMDSSGLGSS